MPGEFEKDSRANTNTDTYKQGNHTVPAKSMLEQPERDISNRTVRNTRVHCMLTEWRTIVIRDCNWMLFRWGRTLAAWLCVRVVLRFLALTILTFSISHCRSLWRTNTCAYASLLLSSTTAAAAAATIALTERQNKNSQCLSVCVCACIEITSQLITIVIARCKEQRLVARRTWDVVNLSTRWLLASLRQYQPCLVSFLFGSLPISLIRSFHRQSQRQS